VDNFRLFPVLPGSAEAQVIWGGIVKCLLITYFTGNISVKKCENPFTYVKEVGTYTVYFFGDGHAVNDKEGIVK